jgi:hypothetical protein
MSQESCVMSTGSLSFSSLPWFVQDNILDKLDQATLASVCLTSASLYRAAKKHLYRTLVGYQNYRSLVEHNLRSDPSIVPYIRSFTSYDESFLLWMWSLAPPLLKELELRWLPQHDDN